MQDTNEPENLGTAERPGVRIQDPRVCQLEFCQQLEEGPHSMEYCQQKFDEQQAAKARHNAFCKQLLEAHMPFGDRLRFSPADYLEALKATGLYQKPRKPDPIGEDWFPDCWEGEMRRKHGHEPFEMWRRSDFRERKWRYRELMEKQWKAEEEETGIKKTEEEKEKILEMHPICELVKLHAARWRRLHRDRSNRHIPAYPERCYNDWNCELIRQEAREKRRLEGVFEKGEGTELEQFEQVDKRMREGEEAEALALLTAKAEELVKYWTDNGIKFTAYY